MGSVAGSSELLASLMPAAGEDNPCFMSWTPHGILAILWGVRRAHLGVHGSPRKSNMSKLELGLKSVLLKTE